MPDTIERTAAPAVIVRHAHAADADELRPLIERYLTDHAVTPAPGEPGTEQLTGERDGALLVAECRSAIVGFAALRVESSMGLAVAAPARVARIAAIYVDAERRRGGIGRALIARARAWGAAKGASAMAIELPPDSRDLERLCTALGYAGDDGRLTARIG